MEKIRWMEGRKKWKRKEDGDGERRRRRTRQKGVQRKKDESEGGRDASRGKSQTSVECGSA